MKNKKKKSRPWDREPSDTPDVIWGGVHGTNVTQGVTDTTRRYPETGVPMPSIEDVVSNRNWVNFNEL